MPLSVLLGFVLLVVLWGTTWGAIKIGVAAVPAFLFAFERAVAAVPTTALQAAAGALVLLPLALTDLGRPARWDAASFAAFVYLVVFGTCVGFAIFVWLLQRLRPTTVFLQQVIIPAEAVLIGALFLGEEVTWHLVAGLVLVAAAVLLSAFASRRPVALAS